MCVIRLSRTLQTQRGQIKSCMLAKFSSADICIARYIMNEQNIPASIVNLKVVLAATFYPGWGLA